MRRVLDAKSPPRYGSAEGSDLSDLPASLPVEDDLRNDAESYERRRAQARVGSIPLSPLYSKNCHDPNGPNTGPSENRRLERDPETVHSWGFASRGPVLAHGGFDSLTFRIHPERSRPRGCLNNASDGKARQARSPTDATRSSSAP